MAEGTDARVKKPLLAAMIALQKGATGDQAEFIERVYYKLAAAIALAVPEGFGSDPAHWTEEVEQATTALYAAEAAYIANPDLYDPFIDAGSALIAAWRASACPETATEGVLRRGTRVTLPTALVEEAERRARVVYEDSMQKGLTDYFGTPRFDNLLIGLLGEAVVHHATGLPWWGGVGRYGEPDVGPFQVRTMRHDRTGLKVRPKDNDDHVVVGVVVRDKEAHVYEVVGAFRAGDAKQHPEWESDPGDIGRPAFFVPSGALKDVKFTLRQEQAA